METQNLSNIQTTKKTFDFHKVFAAVGVILIVMVIICGGVWYFVQSAEDKAGTVDENTVIKTTTSPAKTATKSAEKDETDDWKNYQNTEAKFQIKYPPDWKLEYLDKWNGNQDSTLSGKEGAIDFIWGDGLGGACARPVEEKIQLKNEQVSVCHIASSTTETWGLFRPTGVLADTEAKVNAPVSTNRDVVLKIISTYEAIK